MSFQLQQFLVLAPVCGSKLLPYTDNNNNLPQADSAAHNRPRYSVRYVNSMHLTGGEPSSRETGKRSRPHMRQVPRLLRLEKDGEGGRFNQTHIHKKLLLSRLHKTHDVRLTDTQHH